MHELSIAISLIEQIIQESAAREELRAGAIEAVHLRLGVFSGVDKDALLFSYGLACEGTPLEGSRLEIEAVPLVVHCMACDADRSPPSVWQICCPDCGTPAPDIVIGREIEVRALEIAA